MNRRNLRFLDKNLNPRKRDLAIVSPEVANNAADAEEALGLPRELFIDLTAELRARDIESSIAWARCRNSHESAIIMGFVIGYYEATHQEKKL
jgi:hypothetical protein